jgi:hypothetical protein
MSNYEEHSMTVENFHDQVILAAEARDIGILSPVMTVRRLHQVRHNATVSVITKG